MSLKDIEYGSLASSSDMNNNFRYLENEIGGLSDLITEKTATFSSNVATLNSSVKDVLAYKSSFFQTGMIISTVSSIVPDGFLLCDGSEVYVADYPDLYEVIGTTFGSSDSTKFCLPDLRDKTLWGVGTSELGVSLTSKLPNIKGRIGNIDITGASSTGAFYRSGSSGKLENYGGSADPNVYFDASRVSDVYSDGVSIVQPPALVVNFVIKY